MTTILHFALLYPNTVVYTSLHEPLSLLPPGPVRHFMEMVVTGLSKNPHYTAQEKRDYVEWYRDYFAQFSDEELQTQTAAVGKDVE